MAFFALTRAEDPVVEGVQRVAEVGLLKAVVVQNFQSVENPADGEACRGESHRDKSNKTMPEQVTVQINTDFQPVEEGRRLGRVRLMLLPAVVS